MAATVTGEAPSGTVAGTRVEVFLGKGGVGKTTCSAATALQLADDGQASLVVSTDPTPSLSHIFDITGEHREREVRPGLFLTELGLEDVRNMWNEAFGRDVYGVFSSFVDIDYGARDPRPVAGPGGGVHGVPASRRGAVHGDDSGAAGFVPAGRRGGGTGALRP